MERIMSKPSLSGPRAPSPSGTQHPECFPYEVLLAYSEGRLEEAERKRIEERLRAGDARYQAHLASVRDLDLERIAAWQDARDLEAFTDVQITDFCEAVAQGEGAVLLPLVRGEAESAAGHS